MCPTGKDNIHFLKPNDIRDHLVPPVRVVRGHSGDETEEEKETGKCSPADGRSQDNGVTDDERFEMVDR